MEADKISRQNLRAWSEVWKVERWREKEERRGLGRAWGSGMVEMEEGWTDMGAKKEIS